MEKKCNVLVTGNDQGLGKAIEDLLRQQDKFRVLGIPGSGLRRLDWRSIRFTLSELLKEYHQIDAVINNYGINHLSWIGETSSEDADILLVNVMVPYWIVNCLKAKSQTCRVINIASLAGRIPQRCTSLYCASKAALIHMTRCMARELAPKGWTVNCLCPGKIEGTRMTQLTDIQILKLRQWTFMEANNYAHNLIPMERFTNPTEVAQMVLEMLNWPSYVNGAIVDMTGGQ